MDSSRRSRGELLTGVDGEEEAPPSQAHLTEDHDSLTGAQRSKQLTLAAAGGEHGPGPALSCESLKSDESMGRAINFRGQQLFVDGRTYLEKPGDSELSCLSLESYRSKDLPPDIQGGHESSEEREDQQHQADLDSTLQLLEETVMTIVKKEVKRVQRFLSPNDPRYLDDVEEVKVKCEEEQMRSSREAFMLFIMNLLTSMKAEELADILWSRNLAAECSGRLKRRLQTKFHSVSEGVAKAGNSVPLKQIYTELYITEGETDQVNQEHEVRQIETATRKQTRPETTIRQEDLFKVSPERERPIRSLLTKGVAGIGKTLLTQKLTLDWAEDQAHKNFQLMFPFTFRELNLLKEKKLSLVELVHRFFPEAKESGLSTFEGVQVLFILDGLDECRLPLDFNSRILTEATESTSVDVLLTNLIRGKLLPSAHLWITTRPAAANQIPPECVDMVTEVRGFTDLQKEEYFRKRFRDEEQTTIISHIRSSRSLYIMCHIPIFCWITATVLEDMFKSRETTELPKTLTEMYIHFLVVQAKVKKLKYHGGAGTDTVWTPESRKMIESLGKLAFEQLQRGNLIFYESDLTERGIDVTAAAVYSGVFTQIFREERGLYQDKVFCFIHLSLQEFLAALHVHLEFFNSGVNLLESRRTHLLLRKFRNKHEQFFHRAINEAVESPNGHLDLFLRFLLGLSLQTSQSLFKGLLPQTGSSSWSHQDTAELIKKKISENVSPERIINLFHCLSEVKDTSLVTEVQQQLRSGRLSTDQFSPAQWSTLAFILLSSEEDLDVFDLKKYSASEKALERLLPVVQASRRVLLSSCHLSERSGALLSSVLSSPSSSLTQLHLSYNNLKDVGVELLSAGLKSPHCHLETLGLRGCQLSKRSGALLSSVLSSRSSRLKELDLSVNDLQDPGVELLSAGLKSPHCHLKTLSLSRCDISERGCASLASALTSIPCHLRQLDLSFNQTYLDKPGDSEQSCLSLESYRSKDLPPDIQGGHESSEEREDQQHQADLDSTLQLLEETVMTIVKKEVKRVQRFLSPNDPRYLDDVEEVKVKCEEEQMRSSREAFMLFIMNLLTSMKAEELADILWSRNLAAECSGRLKRRLQTTFHSVSEGVAKAGNSVPLKQIYTELYITEGETDQVNQEHEVRQIETATRKQTRPETTIRQEDLFKVSPERERPIRSLLTKGVAGIGKTLLTQKLTLDWAEDQAHKNFQLMFPFTFRELNLLKEKKLSLVELVHRFFPEAKESGLSTFEGVQVLFILDGLDECRLPLDFNSRILTEATESTSVDVLLTNLIRGKLLPSAHLWITTRPAAANQIPPECVDMVTEVRGFTDLQKEEYFRKRFRDEEQTTIISHIRSSRSLYIMCHIPIFCWITATVLEDMFKSRETTELPKTLTEMYIHFLVVQAKVKKLKYHGGAGTDTVWTPESRKMIESLGKLAFEQLQRGNLIFYESDLTERGIDVTAAAVYSGVFTQIFREERGLYQDKVFCFIHLSLQEFLAALHVHLEFFNSGVNLLESRRTHLLLRKFRNKHEQFFHRAINEAVESPNGHLDLFLRFLLGLSLQTSQSLFKGLLPQTGSSSWSHQDTAELIKKKISENVSPERIINLFHCLSEVKDTSLVTEVQQQLRSGRLSTDQFSPAQWSTLAFILLSSEEDLDVFDLKKYSASEKALERLLPVVQASRRVLLSSCHLSERSGALLSSVLSSPSSSLTQLHLSYNNLKDVGVEQLSAGLKSPHCHLETLGLRGCQLSKRSGALLSSVLSSRSSRLKELDLSVNDLQDPGVELLSAGLKSPHCHLKTLRLSSCHLSERSGALLSSVLSSPSSSLTQLDLSINNLKDVGVELLSAGLKSPHCHLETLSLSRCDISERGCASLASALTSIPCHLRQLDLSFNHAGGPGLELLSAELKSLRLDHCGPQWLK
ncbi:uncharacterized protein ACB058_012272 [Synchiropus picturatus]